MGICSIGCRLTLYYMFVTFTYVSGQDTTPGMVSASGISEIFLSSNPVNMEDTSIGVSSETPAESTTSSVFISEGVGSLDAEIPVNTPHLVSHTVSIQSTPAIPDSILSLIDISQELKSVSMSDFVAFTPENDEIKTSFAVMSDVLQRTPLMDSSTFARTSILQNTVPELTAFALHVESHHLESSYALESSVVYNVRTQALYPDTVILDQQSSYTPTLSTILYTAHIQPTQVIHGELLSTLKDSQLLSSHTRDDIASFSFVSTSMEFLPVSSISTSPLPIISAFIDSSLEPFSHVFTESISLWNVSFIVASQSWTSEIESTLASDLQSELPISPTQRFSSIMYSSDELMTSVMGSRTISFHGSSLLPTFSIESANEAMSITDSLFDGMSPVYSVTSDLLSSLTIDSIPPVPTMIDHSTTQMPESYLYTATSVFPETSSFDVINTMPYPDYSSSVIPQTVHISENITDILSTGQMLTISPTFSSDFLNSYESKMNNYTSNVEDITNSFILSTSTFDHVPDIDSKTLINTLIDIEPTPQISLIDATPTYHVQDQTLSASPSSTDLASISEISPSPTYEIISPSSAWLDNTTHATDNVTDAYNYTDSPDTTPLPTPKPTPEWVLNTSDAWADNWVKTVLKIPVATEVESAPFRQEMETKFATILNEGLIRLADIFAGTYKPLRKKRAVRVSNATVQMTNITRSEPNEPSHTTLVYYLIEGQPTNNITTADRTVGLMELFNNQELAIMLGYEVVLKAEVYVQPTPPKDKKLWIIGAVLGGVAGLIIFIWLILCMYFKCTRAPTKHPSPHSPRSAKISDIDQDYKTKDVKGFDYARTEVGLENELDRQNVPDYYRRYPMGSTELEGMYSPGETPPPPFRGHRPSSAGSQGNAGSRGEPSHPPPPPPIDGFLSAIKTSETQSKSRKKKGVDDTGSTEHDTEDTERSEDRKPLSKKGHRRHKPKSSGQFENLTKMSRIDDPESLVAPTRTTVHAIKAPALGDSLNDDSLQSSEKDVEDTLRQKAELERWRNKQRQREKKSGQKKHSKNPVGDSKEERRAYHKDQQDIGQVLMNGHHPEKPKRKKKKPKKSDESIEPVDSIELQAVPDHRIIQPVLPSMKHQLPVSYLESDSSDDGLDPALDKSGGSGSHDKARELVNALLNEAFAMVTPTPQSNPPGEPHRAPEPDQPPPPLPTDTVSRHTPLYIAAVKGQPSQPPGMWNPYEASDQAANIIPSGKATPKGSYSSGRSPRQHNDLSPRPRSPHQYTNPAYMADLPVDISTQPLTSSDINGSSTPRSGRNMHNGFMPESPSAFRPYERPNWTDSIPRAWDDPDKTLPIGNRFSGKQQANGDVASLSKPNTNDLSRFYVPKPTQRDVTDDEIDIASDAMKTGNSAQPLIASIREEIERLAKRPQDHNSLRLPTT